MGFLLKSWSSRASCTGDRKEVPIKIVKVNCTDTLHRTLKEKEGSTLATCQVRKTPSPKTVAALRHRSPRIEAEMSLRCLT